MQYKRNSNYGDLDVVKLRETEKGQMEILEHYKLMVYKLIQGYKISGYTHQDLESICNLMILEKIKLYDSSRGSFTTYIYPCLQGMLKNTQRRQFRKHCHAMTTSIYWDAFVNDQGEVFPIPSNENVEKQVENKITYEWVMNKAKEILPDDRYMIFKDTVEESQKYAIEKYGRAQSTVNSIYLRTIDKLKKLEGLR